MIPSVSSRGVKFPPNSSSPPGGFSLTLCSKRERSPYGRKGPPRTFEGSSGTGCARAAIGCPAPATSAAPRAAPPCRNRRRLGACSEDSEFEAASLIGASLADEAVCVTVAVLHLRRERGEIL